MQNFRLKFLSYSIIFADVPNEISLGIGISGCPHRCEGCHSPYLWEYDGKYLDENIDNLICKYKNGITCVCLFGGDQNQENLYEIIKIIKSYNLKVCLYSGLDDINMINKKIIDCLDYIKIGSYNKELGGLESPSTNQKMFDLKNNKEIKFYENTNN